MGRVELCNVIDCDCGVEPAVLKPQTDVETEAAYAYNAILLTQSWSGTPQWFVDCGVGAVSVRVSLGGMPC